MADEVQQAALDGGDTQATTKAENAARIAALDDVNAAVAAAEAAKLAAYQTAYSAAIVAEEACASSVNAVLNVDPYAPPPEE